MRPVEGADGGPEDEARAERWRRIKALFFEALDRPESERHDFVVRAGATDSSIRNEVLSLLASAKAAGTFGETPAYRAIEADVEPEPGTEPQLAPGTRLGAYEITDFISAGGMGEVYRARHSVLGRDVALKTLQAGSDDPQARRRLIREARHAASLQHPGVCAIHEVVEDEARPFIVMEYVEGRTLSEILSAGIPPLESVLDWSLQIADALSHAHGAGIVHRDLKASNVVINNAGRAKVLDFGLSRRVIAGATPESTVTIHGALAGTLSHMAPEVLLGRPADVRSDIWSLGVLLHELTTGSLPFQGRTPFETSDAILNDPPRPARGVPLAIRLVIERCLAKDPDERYGQVRQVHDALAAIRRRSAWRVTGRMFVRARRRTLAVAFGACVVIAGVVAGTGLLARGAVGPRASTLAILPLENATGDEAAEFYAQGLTEALTDQLGGVADVRVISRGSAARAAAMSQSDRDAARQLGADVIATGRLRTAGDRIAVDLRLMNAANGRVFWSDTYERSANQVLALQADAVRALVAEVRLGIRPDARSNMGPARNVNPEAYEAYLKGRYEWNRRSPESIRAAVAHFEHALDLDPTWAPAWAALADCYNQLGTQMVGTGSPAQFRPQAEAAAIRALQIDPASAEAHATLGYIRHYNWQWDDADREFQRAIQLNPSNALARIWYANLLATRWRTDDALAQVYAARDLDPFSLIVNTNVGWILSMAGRNEEAVEQLSRTVALDPSYLQAHMRLIGALASVGRLEEARKDADQLLAIGGRTVHVLDILGNLSILAGDTATARGLLAELVERASFEYVPPGTIVAGYTRLGDIDEALVWVRKAFEERANYVVYMQVGADDSLLLRDPRFQELVNESGLNRGR